MSGKYQDTREKIPVLSMKSDKNKHFHLYDTVTQSRNGKIQSLVENSPS